MNQLREGSYWKWKDDKLREHNIGYWVKKALILNTLHNKPVTIQPIKSEKELPAGLQSWSISSAALWA